VGIFKFSLVGSTKNQRMTKLSLKNCIDHAAEWWQCLFGIFLVIYQRLHH
jgi:hypothetical protein